MKDYKVLYDATEFSCGEMVYEYVVWWDIPTERNKGAIIRTTDYQHAAEVFFYHYMHYNDKTVEKLLYEIRVYQPSTGHHFYVTVGVAEVKRQYHFKTIESENNIHHE